MLKCHNCQLYFHPPKNLKTNRKLTFCRECHQPIKNLLKTLYDINNNVNITLIGNQGVIPSIKKDIVNQIQNNEELLSRNPHSKDSWFQKEISLSSPIRIYKNKNKHKLIRDHFSRMIVGKFLFKIIIYLHRWKWRAIEKYYKPDVGRGYILSLQDVSKFLIISP